MSDLRVKLRLDVIDKISSPVRKMATGYVDSLKRMQSVTKGLRDNLNSTGKSITGLGAKMTSIKAPAAMLTFGALAVKTSASVEDLMSSLETATGSQQAANEAFAEINKFARTTPYELGQVLNSYIKLKNLGLDPSMESLRSFGNTASSMGKDLDQMIEAVADAATGEFERLKEFGIRASVQGKKVSFTFRGIKTTVKNDAASIQEYLKSIGDVNFAGAMDKKMNNFNGVMSNFMDTLSATMNKAGMQITESLNLKVFFNGLSDSIQSLTDSFMSLPSGIRDSVVVGGLLLSVIGPLVMGIGQFAIGIGGMVYAFGFVAPALIAAGVAFKTFSIALLTTPIGWILLGITALAAGAYLLISNWDSVSAFFSNLWTGIKSAFATGIDYVMTLLGPLLEAIKFVSKGVTFGMSLISGDMTGVKSSMETKETTSPALSPALPISDGPRQTVDTGGMLRIKIESDGRASVVEKSPNDKRMDYTVDSGLMMGAY